jgi:apolipoprotein N-acyltransferase
MFIYPNALITLMWGWQFIVAALFGVAAVLLPDSRMLFTVIRYLLLVPAFILTSVYQKPRLRFLRMSEWRVAGYLMTMERVRFWAGMGLSAASGLLLATTMPNFDVGLLGWLALVPLLLAIYTAPIKEHFLLALPFGLIWSIAVHNWYPNIFPPALGYFLIIAVGTFYAGMIQLGTWLQSRLSGILKLLALPITWAAIEYIKFIAPVVEDWWFVLLAKSQWRFPPALQILSITGFPGLSFMIMLANVALAFLLLRALREQKVEWRSVAALALVAAIVGWGALTIPSAPAESFTIAAITDMVNQDQAIQASGEFDGQAVGYIANRPEMSQAIFDLNATLTRSIANQQPAFVVWSENEFSDIDDPQFIDQLKGLAQEVNSYIVADVVWNAPSGMHDTALLVGPEGNEIGRRAKINTTAGEEERGFVPGAEDFPLFDTPYGTVGISVCWDIHRLWITRELARAGADIILMPMDNDFNSTPWFPPYHASDAIFRAVENRTAVGTVNGLSLVIDPYGRMTAQGGINERGVIVGESFTVSGQTPYTRWGDWFGWLMVGLTAVLIGKAQKNEN